MTDAKSLDAKKTGTEQRPMVMDARLYMLYPGTDSVNLLECVRLFYRERRLIAVIVGTVIAVSILAALVITPVYRAEVLLAPAPQEGNEGPSPLMSQLGGIAALVGGSISNPKDRTAESIATLRSRSLASDFIHEQNLKPVLFAAKWDAGQQRWRDPDDVPTDFQAYDVFDKQVRTVNVDRRTGLVSVLIEWTDPVLAAAWANRLVTAVNRRRRDEAIHEAQQSIKYLEQQLPRTSSVEIQQSISRLIETQMKTIALANAREEYAFRVIDPAVAPERRVRPKRLLIVALGVVFGLLLAIGTVFVRRILAREGTVAASV